MCRGKLANYKAAEHVPRNIRYDGHHYFSRMLLRFAEIVELWLELGFMEMGRTAPRTVTGSALEFWESETW